MKLNLSNTLASFEPLAFVGGLMIRFLSAIKSLTFFQAVVLLLLLAILWKVTKTKGR